MVTLTALKWTGVSPTDGSLVEATTVRAVDGAGGGVCPAAGAASTAAQIRKLPSVVDRMSLSLNEVILGKVWRQPGSKGVCYLDQELDCLDIGIAVRRDSEIGVQNIVGCRAG